jgi:hypothetical protein
MFTPMPDRLEAHLLGQTSQRLSFWHEVRAGAVIGHLPADRGAVVADIGAGAGLLGEVVRRDRPSCEYRFYEPLDTLADRLEQRHGSTARLPAGVPPPDADLVTLLDVIEHVDDDRRLLAEVIEPMPTGAALVVTVPALPALWSPWDEELGHRRRYTRDRLRAAFAGLPVDVVEVSYLFPELIPPAVVRRLAGGRVGRDRSKQVSEYPELPVALDRSLRAVGATTYRARRWWPVGTSLIAVARRR